MRIGDVARRAGVSTRALRYYEEQGLLTSERSPRGQRTYPESAVERVRLIQQFFAAGVPSRTILQLMPYVDAGHGSREAFALLTAERDRITAAMADLAAARDALDRMIDIANHPTAEHCPALREPPWTPYRPADPAASATSDRDASGRSMVAGQMTASAG
ncbi:MerR family transcriptional regulator [Micromonospora sp. NPDC049900]|uniref:MerR family transcriptional regulator n=1 Tax=Micromonospora sp. NPDC049900 TaxID=3364275 RepID=UPI00379A7A57